MTDQDALFILGLIVSAILCLLALLISDPEDEPEGYKGGQTPDKYKVDDHNTFTISPSRARRSTPSQGYRHSRPTKHR